MKVNIDIANDNHMDAPSWWYKRVAIYTEDRVLRIFFKKAGESIINLYELNRSFSGVFWATDNRLYYSGDKK